MHPTKDSLIELIRDARKGEVVLPEFQRSFIWERRAIEELLVSIFNNYFIGAFLTLNVLPDDPPFKARKIEGCDEPDLHAKKMVLDGQQRLTSVHYSLYGPEIQLKNTSYPYRFFLNIDAALEEDWEEAVYSRSTSSNHTALVFKDCHRQYEQGILSFAALRSWEEWTRWYDGFRDYHRQQGTFDEGRTEALSELARRFLNYQVALIEMPQKTPLETVVEVFERINRTGSPLSVFELLTARLWKQEINLRELWEESRDKYAWLGRLAADKSERYPKFTLQLIALLRGRECKRKDLILLEPEGFAADWGTSARYLNEALARMHSTAQGGYGVVSEVGLPYSTLTPTLAALLQHIDSQERGKEDAYSKLHYWYWGSVFTERYGGPVETLSQRDYLQVSRWMSAAEALIPDAVTTEESQIQRDLKQVVRQGAVYKGIMCLVALRGATDFFSGDSIELHSLDDHHIFPQDFLKGRGHGQDERNTILNRTLVSSDTNQRIIRAKRPSVYLAEMERLLGETKALEILRSHFINAAGRDAMRSDDYGAFLRAREDALRREIERRCVYSPIGLAPVQPSSEMVESGEENRRLDRAEVALRDVIDETLADALGETYWKQVVPEDIRKAVGARSQTKAREGGPDAPGGSSTRDHLDFLDFSDYERLILQKNLWPCFVTAFERRGDTERHLIALRRYRNGLKHGRELDGVTRLNGNAAVIWLEQVLGIKDFVETIEAQAEATKEDCLRLLVRRSIPRGQQELYSALLQAPDQGLTSEELVQAMGRRHSLDLSGVLGALGTRVNGTPGYGAARKPGIEMVLKVASASSGAKKYRLRSQMVRALAELNPAWLPAGKAFVQEAEPVIDQAAETESRWNGRDFYISLGEGESRTWEDCREYGFVSGGQGKWYSQTLNALFPGARVFVNAPGSGFVGVGEVTGISTPVTEFKVEVDGVEIPIVDAPLRAINVGKNKDDPELCEYMVPVEWVRAVPREEGYWEKGLFAIQHTACRLRDQLTIERLTRHFGLEGSSRTPLTPAQQLWMDYWGAFGEFLQSQGAEFSPPRPQKRHWVSWGIGRSGFELSAIVSSRDKHVDVLLYLGDENSKAHFHLLSSMKDVIEKQLGFAVEWLEKPDQKGSSIAVRRVAETTDRASWPDLQAWTLGKLTAFDRVFRPLVRDLKASDWEPSRPTE